MWKYKHLKPDCTDDITKESVSHKSRTVRDLEALRTWWRCLRAHSSVDGISWLMSMMAVLLKARSRNPWGTFSISWEERREFNREGGRWCLIGAEGGYNERKGNIVRDWGKQSIWIYSPFRGCRERATTNLAKFINQVHPIATPRSSLLFVLIHRYRYGVYRSDVTSGSCFWSIHYNLRRRY